ncbi:sulfatase-like hydrolase/transferase [Gloeocapsopsis crepidinum LEGE 06123]|uniref:Sulfatase-like hydrolase/transferase n=1 Tax=Gloeocapsopsis crepidinum LEGE 06123 TaxID=588587 RepID=A0ABR9UYT5_9CHRO|nr:sulfatase-like hydrolase/transferase [Gloeocapsopsis crepidinum]MBE9193489.1 sulfatase-like hydrolase/transferase [Gloeocapsopsis crepidinum LEGE 06123]
MTTNTNNCATNRPNILILCMDQWDATMAVPDVVQFPAMKRLEAQGTRFERNYCTVPICTPSRSTMWTGVHAKHTGLWDNTNFAWIGELTSEIPTIGHMLRQQGYYTAFKGKWHLSEVEQSEDTLERYGFADYQQWGDMFGAPLQGAQLDGTVAFETVDWLETKAPSLDQPWLLISSMVNPHDVMFFQSDPIEQPEPNGAMNGLQTTKQRLGWFEQQWDVTLPPNFADDYALQPPGVRNYKQVIDQNYGRVPDNREDLWLERRNYLINCMRLVDSEFGKILDVLDRRNLWDNTVVLLISDHGEMNGAHRMAQKGAIAFDEAAISYLTAVVPGGAQGKRTVAVSTFLDLAPTLLEFAGLGADGIKERYPHLKGRSMRSVMFDASEDGPRGSVRAPGDGGLFCWDGLNMLDPEWTATGALKELTNMGSGPRAPKDELMESMKEAGQQFGAPDWSKRNFFRTVVDGQYKLVRWFSPQEFGNPATLDELYATSDVGLYDLVNDPGELDNIGNQNHPNYDPQLVDRMLTKLNALVEREIGDDRCPFDLDMFGTREVKYRKR